VVPQADGSWAIRGRLEPEVGAVLRAALAAAADALHAGEAGDSAEAAADPAKAAADAEAAEPAEAEHAAARRGASECSAASADGVVNAAPSRRPVIGRAERYEVVVHVSAPMKASASRGRRIPLPPCGGFRLSRLRAPTGLARA